MPRPGPRRQLVAFRLSAEETSWLDQRAEAEGLVNGKGEPNRSEMNRRALAYAREHMPPGWLP